MLSVAIAQAAPAQTAVRYRVAANNAWFYQDVGGRRIAQLVRGAVLTAGTGNATRSDFELAVTRAPHENLRAKPAGPLIAELAQGFGLKRAGAASDSASAKRWMHVTRDGWVQRSAVEPLADVADTRTASASDSDNVAPPPAFPVSTTSAPAGKLDSTRAQPVRMTTLYRAPAGPEAGTVATDTPLRVLSRNGEWTRVQFEGWVKGGDLQVAPAGVMVGVTAAELRAEPQRYVGQQLRWQLEFIAIQKADDLRPDIPSGASYVLARGPLPERGFVYVIVPDIKLPTFRALNPLAQMQVIVRVRNGRSRYLGNPVVDLVSLEGGTTP